jgi:hypothetical protein
LRGPNGPATAVLDFADFFSLVSGEGGVVIAPGADVPFSQAGPSAPSTGIVATSFTTFRLSDIGSYQILFQLSVTEPAQVFLTLNGTPLLWTTVGRSAVTSQIVGMTYVNTTFVNSIITLRNPPNNALFTLTGFAGGTVPVSAHLVITRVQ